MATITQNISNNQTVDQALASYHSQQQNNMGYLETYLGNIDLLNPTFTAVNNNIIAGVLNNGDSFTFIGSNLQGSPATLNSLTYNSVEGITFSAIGALTVQNSTDVSMGGFTTMVVEDNRTDQSVTHTYQGSFTADAMQITSMTVTSAESSIQLTGDFTFDQNDMPIGTITGLQVTANGQTNSVEDISLDIANFNQSTDYAAVLANVTSGDDTVTGGEGYDTAIFNFNQADLLSIRPLKSGGVEVTSADGTDTLVNIEHIDFLDGSSSITTLLANQPMPAFSLAKDDQSNQVSPDVYTGPVTYLQYQLIGDSDGEVVSGTSGNDFINLLAGDDAANGGAGDDVLDGGVGSNFLSGGSGDDTFFLDGRSGENTWSTITDFSQDTVNIWGWEEGQSQLLLTEQSAGAEGFEGVTFHYDLNNDGNIDTSITFTGLTENDVQASAQSVAGNGYLLIS